MGTGAKAALVGLGIAAALAGCAGKRIEHGVFHSPKGYRIAVPAGWAPALDGRADLELRRPDEEAGMLVNAACDAGALRRGADVLVRYPLFGLRDRAILEKGAVSLDGRPAAHTVVEGRMRGEDERVKVELYVVKGERCVYDFLYVAPPATFDTRRPDFQRFVETFAME